MISRPNVVVTSLEKYTFFLKPLLQFHEEGTLTFLLESIILFQDILVSHTRLFQDIVESPCDL